MVAICEESALRRSEFPPRGTFFENADSPFAKVVEKWVGRLLAWGREVELQTMTDASHC